MNRERFHATASVAILSLLTFQCGDEGEQRHYKEIGNAAWSPTEMNSILISKIEYDYAWGKRSGCGTEAYAEPLPPPPFDLFIADTMANITKRLGSSVQAYSQPIFKWSPKGDRFVVWNEYDSPVRIIDTAGNVTRIDSLASAFDLDWFPGGGEILIAGRKFGALKNQLLVYSLSGTLTQWTDTIVPGHLSLSPGGRIAVQCFKDSSVPGGVVTKSYLAVLNPYENDFRRIYKFRAGTSELRWSPDDRKLLFSDLAESTSTFQLFELPFDGGTAFALTAITDNSQPYWFSYSPDGTLIQYTKYMPGSSELRVMDASGNSDHLVASTWSAGSWSPDSRRVVYVYNKNLYAANVR